MDDKPVPHVSPISKPFWDAAARGKLLAQRCLACGSYVFYPRAWCPHCFGLELEWKEMTGKGEVHTYSVVHAAPCVGFEADVPYVLAVVQLEEGTRMMANVIGCRPDVVRVGLAVEVVFEDRDGVRLPQFTPVRAT